MPKKKSALRGYALPAQVLAARYGTSTSGAAGVHSDQKTRRLGVTRTNRVNTRSAALRSVVADQQR